MKVKRKDGFTIVEVIVAMAILAIVMAPLIGLLTGSFGGIFTAGTKSAAQYKAHKAMENALADQTVTETGTSVTSVTNSYTVRFGTSDVVLSGKEVTVTVNYQDTNGNARTVTYKSIVPN